MEPKQFLDLKDNEKDMSSDKHLQKCIYRNITYSIWDIDTQTLHSDLLQVGGKRLVRAFLLQNNNPTFSLHN